jgi:hypothetical protein
MTGQKSIRLDFFFCNSCANCLAELFVLDPEAVPGEMFRSERSLFAHGQGRAEALRLQGKAEERQLISVGKPTGLFSNRIFLSYSNQ